MSCNTDEEVRVILKYSTITGTEPTIPASGDHEDGTWLPTDLYVGELFMNSVDEKLWIRTDNGIVGIGGTAGATFSGIYDYVHISGGTYSGEVYAPTFSSIGIVAQNIYGDIFQGNAGASASFIGNFFGDGSGLTGIISEWLGGTVSNPVHFTDRVDFTNDIYIDGTIYSNNPNIVINSSLEVSGGVSASIFYGDGSGLTNLPTGTYSDTYTATAALTGNTILFTRNDASDYSVDLTPILATQGVAMIQWDDTTDVLSLYMNDSSQLGITIDTFAQVNSTGAITAPEFYGGTFYGSFVGDITGVIGATGPAGATGAPGPAGATGTGGTLEQTLIAGNTMGTQSIDFSDGTIDFGFGTKLISQNDPLYNYTQVSLSTNITGSGSENFISMENTLDGVRITSTEDDGIVYRQSNFIIGPGSISLTSPGDISISSNSIDLSSGNQQITDSINGFGIRYAEDYSATFLERSLVDKGYVDGILNNMTLENALKSGNTTGTQSIYISSSASVIEGYNGIRHHWYDASNPILGDYYRIENGTGASSSYIMLEDDVRGNIRIANNNLFDTASSYSENTTVIVGQGDIQHNATTRDYVGGTVWGSTNQTIYMNGSDMVTRDYILDTTGWVATSTTGVYLQGARNGGLSASDITITPENIVSRTENDGYSWTQIEQKTDVIIVSGSASHFRGFEYAEDYSATFTSRSLVDKSYLETTINATDITYAALEAAANFGSLTKGTTYFITDRKIWIKALDTNLLSTSAQRSQQIIKDEAYQMVGTLGVWNSDLAPSIGDKTIWNAELWTNTTGINSIPDALEDWSLITTDALYYDKIFDIEYDIKYDIINVQSDDRGNILRRSMFSDLICDWGNNNIFDNECSGIYNNSNTLIVGNKITGGIFNNFTIAGVQNNAGNINIHSNTCQAISYNQSTIYGNNIPGNISNNECDTIYNNNGPTSIQYNNNNGSIYNNTTTGAISYNTNTSDIYSNSNGGDIILNSNNGAIAGNSHGGSIEQNSNNGYITNNLNNGSIYWNSNNGAITNNQNVGWIRYNTNMGEISNNSNTTDIENNANNGYISQNSNNGAIGYNTNTANIGSNTNNGYITNNNNNGTIANNSNAGIIFLNSNGGGIFNNTNTGSISSNTNGSDIAYNSIVGYIQNNANRGSIQNNTQTSGTTNITYNNNNGNISGARTANITGTIVNI